MPRVLLNTDDVPTAEEMTHAASRLMKCYTLLSKTRGKSNSEDPDAMKQVASFLSMLSRREKKNLRKDSKPNTEGFDLTINMICTHLLEMDDWELNQVIKDTDLNKVFKRLSKGDDEKRT